MPFSAAETWRKLVNCRLCTGISSPAAHSSNLLDSQPKRLLSTNILTLYKPLRRPKSRLVCDTVCHISWPSGSCALDSRCVTQLVSDSCAHCEPVDTPAFSFWHFALSALSSEPVASLTASPAREVQTIWSPFRSRKSPNFGVREMEVASTLCPLPIETHSKVQEDVASDRL